MHLAWQEAAEEVTILLAWMFHENAVASAFPVACRGVSERTTIKWHKYLTFRRFPAASCRELQLSSRDRGEGCATGQPQGVGSEAYLNSTSQGPTPEDARKDRHIIRARCAPLSPASGFPVSRSQQTIGEMSGPSRSLLGWERSFKT
jgi:hypothetical protein